MQFKSSLSEFLTNKWVLNIVAFLSIFNIIGYISIGNLNAVLFYILFAVLIRYFSKNMIIVLGLPLITVGLFYSMRKSFSFREGMETSESNNQETSNENKNTESTESNESDVVTTNDGSTSMTAINPRERIQNKRNNNANTDESFEVGRGRKGSYNIDYASTIEDAYDELNKILGSDGIKNLTDDTQKLMKQQMMLAESMQSMEPIIKGMGPLLEKAEGLLGNMGDSNGSLDSFKKLAEKFTGNTNKNA